MKIISHNPTFVRKCGECPYLATRFRAGMPSMRVPPAIRYRCWAAQGPVWLEPRRDPASLRREFRERFDRPAGVVIMNVERLERLIGDESCVQGIPWWCPLPDAASDGEGGVMAFDPEAVEFLRNLEKRIVR